MKQFGSSVNLILYSLTFLCVFLSLCVLFIYFFFCSLQRISGFLLGNWGICQLPNWNAMSFASN